MDIDLDLIKLNYLMEQAKQGDFLSIENEIDEIGRSVEKNIQDAVEDGDPIYLIKVQNIRNIIAAMKSDLQKVKKLKKEFDDSKLPPPKGKQGPHRYSDKEKKDAIEVWENLNTNQNPITIEEFLEGRFGAPGGKLNVAKSTFYDWKSKLKKNP